MRKPSYCNQGYRSSVSMIAYFFCSPLLIGEYRGIIKITVQIKMRTYSASPEELWLDEWHSPVERRITVPSIAAIREELVDQTSYVRYGTPWALLISV
jgi:hypothetical protein